MYKYRLQTLYVMRKCNTQLRKSPLEPRDIKHMTLFICNVVTLPPKGASASFVVVLYKSNTHLAPKTGRK